MFTGGDVLHIFGLVVLQSHSPLTFKDHSYYGLEEMRKSFSWRGRRRIWPVSLTLVIGKVMEQIILKTISKHVKGKKLLGVVSMDLWRGSNPWLTWYLSKSNCHVVPLKRNNFSRLTMSPQMPLQQRMPAAFPAVFQRLVSKFRVVILTRGLYFGCSSELPGLLT